MTKLVVQCLFCHCAATSPRGASLAFGNSPSGNLREVLPRIAAATRLPRLFSKPRNDETGTAVLKMSLRRSEATVPQGSFSCLRQFTFWQSQGSSSRNAAACVWDVREAVPYKTSETKCTRRGRRPRRPWGVPMKLAPACMWDVREAVPCGGAYCAAGNASLLQAKKTHPARCVRRWVRIATCQRDGKMVYLYMVQSLQKPRWNLCHEHTKFGGKSHPTGDSTAETDRRNRLYCR